MPPKSSTKKAASKAATTKATRSSAKPTPPPSVGAKRTRSPESESSTAKPAAKRGRKATANTPATVSGSSASKAGPSVQAAATEVVKNNDPKSSATKDINSSSTSGTGAVRHVTTNNEVDASSSTATSPSPNSAIFEGKFDIYGMALPFLSKVYLPGGSSKPQHENLFNTILTYQAKPDFTAQCAIPNLSAPVLQTGSLASGVLCDPMSDEKYDIAVENFKAVDKIEYTAVQRGQFAGIPTTGIPGIVANLSLRDGGCGIASSRGDFRMSRVWTKTIEGKLVELFEGALTLRVNHSGLYQRKGHGSGNTYRFAFWAVRARKDKNGKEIGPDCEDGNSGGSWAAYDDGEFGGLDEDEDDDEDDIYGYHGHGHGYDDYGYDDSDDDYY